MGTTTLTSVQGGVSETVYIHKRDTGSSSSSNLVVAAAAPAPVQKAYPYTTDFISGVERTRNLTSISSSSGFFWASNLSSIYVGSNVTSISSDAFYFATGLTSINIPNSVTSIGSKAFNYCNLLTSITIPESVTSIGSDAFRYTPLGTIKCLATTAPTLGGSAFHGIATSDIHVPVGATGYGTTYGGLTVVADL